MQPVTVQFLKNPNFRHWGFEATFLGEDEHGRWVAVPAGSKRWKGEKDYPPTRWDAVFCAPHEGWWHLHYNGPHSPNYTMFVDINTPPVWDGAGRYEMIDLDLDVAMTHEGEIVVEDEDEFALHQVQYGYTSEMVDAARRAMVEIVEALTNGAEPFFGVAEHWLARTRS